MDERRNGNEGATGAEPSFAPEPGTRPEPVGEPAPAPDAGSRPQRHYVHHSYIWLGSLRIAGIIAAALLVSMFSSMLEMLFQEDGSTGSAFLAIIIVAVVIVVACALAFLYQWWSYRHLWYEIGDEEFSLYSGIFNKKRVHVPYQRVQSVDQHASLLQRIFGVCTMSVDTAGGASHTAVQIPYMRKDQAERLRMELYLRKRRVLGIENPSSYPAPSGAPAVVRPAPAGAQATVLAAMQPGAPASSQGNVLDIGAEVWDEVRGVFAGDAVDMGRSSYECRLSNKELIFTGLSNNTGFAIALLGVLATVFQVVGSLGNAMEAAQGAGAVVFEVGGRIFGGSVVVFGIVAVLLAVIALWAVSVISSCLRFGGFVARRRGNRIEVEHGILQHRIQGVDVDRVQSVVIKQSVIRRLLGYCELSLGKIDANDSSQSDQGQGLAQQGLVIHPFLKADRVPEILSGLIPEFDGIPTQRTGLPRVAVRRAVIRRGFIQGAGFWITVIVAVCHIVANLLLAQSSPEGQTALSYINTAAYAAYAVCAIVFVLEIIAGILWARGSGFAYNRRFMVVANSGMARETVAFPRRKMQFGYTRTNPFQRRARTATIAVRTAAGTGGTTVSLIDVCEDDARTWLEWVVPRSNAVS